MKKPGRLCGAGDRASISMHDRLMVLASRDDLAAFDPHPDTKLAG